MNVANLKKSKKSAINSKLNKAVAGVFGFLGIYMLIINLAVYGNLIPLWIVASSLALLILLPITKVEDDNGKQYLAYWGLIFKALEK